MMRVLSLFDGISCGREALKREGIKVGWYGASEVDKYAIQVSEKNYPDIIRLGDVKTCDIPKDIDILFAGFPCQSFSLAGLTNNTVYYYNITTCDTAGNCVTNGTYSFVRAFSVLVQSGSIHFSSVRISLTQT